MTEAKWCAANDPQEMLHYFRLRYIRRTASDRKLHLFSLACVRRAIHLVPDELGALARAFLEAATVVHDGRQTEDAVAHAHDQLFQATLPKHLDEEAVLAVLEAGRSRGDCLEQSSRVAGIAVSAVANAAVWPLLQEAAGAHTHLVQDEARARERAAQADLLRHIMGNPFRPLTQPAYFPANAVQLAESLHHGADCAFALRDALLEVDHGELADHFSETEHPKGCWALDLILGKA
ncbi:hypothetical protein AYO44_02610 [Planctomycetaceae bacterium SCGC AG-212-F19]|nr:hypothetical protein AYO44_02610 [Planctomycetaceae bacterium SCGC AG-212-F19]